MLDRVIQEIDDHLDDQLAIHLHRDDLLRQRYIERTVLYNTGHMGYSLVDHIIYNLMLLVQHKLIFTDTGHVQNVLDQIGQPDHFVADVGSQLFALSLRQSVKLVGQQGTGACKRREGTAQVMRNRAQQHAPQPLPLHSDPDLFTLTIAVFPVKRRPKLCRDSFDHKFLAE
ncbi:hypothetical protein SDC9_104334 [bioreactor metagenome]|uniref:Uncharacterized protein n=1 Tax=bioreactor metagenome TaxID=1076179 RepID=A0A645AW88_9ZZZZ